MLTPSRRRANHVGAMALSPPAYPRHLKPPALAPRLKRDAVFSRGLRAGDNLHRRNRLRLNLEIGNRRGDRLRAFLPGATARSQGER